MTTLEVKDRKRDLIFYPFLDSYGNDDCFLTGQKLDKLIEYTIENQNIAAFNTNACMKFRWNPLTAGKAFGASAGSYAKPSSSKELKIPKIVHQIWISSEPHTKEMMTLRDMVENNGWKYMLHDEKSISDFKLVNKAAYDACSSNIGKINIAEYEILHKYGGIYIAADSELLRPFNDSLLVHEFFAAFENEEHNTGIVSPDVIGSIVGSPILKQMIDDINKIPLSKIKLDYSVTGSHLLTYYLKTLPVTEIIQGAFIYPSYYFYPVYYDGTQCSYDLIMLSYTNHSWTEFKKSIIHVEPKQEDKKNPVPKQEDRKASVPKQIVTPVQQVTTTPIVVDSSSLTETEIVRSELSKLLTDYKIISVIDAGCGNFSWMSHLITPTSKIKYTGIDTDDAIIGRNKKLSKLDFKTFNLKQTVVPSSDLIICRDCLNYLSDTQVKEIINNFKISGSKYLLATSHVGRRTNVKTDSDTWHTINLQMPPFSLPKPILTINEMSTDSTQADKSICLWSLSQIPQFKL